MSSISREPLKRSYGGDRDDTLVTRLSQLFIRRDFILSSAKCTFSAFRVVKL